MNRSNIFIVSVLLAVLLLTESGWQAQAYPVAAGSTPLMVDTWTPLPIPGAPSARYGHAAIWTGTEMIVWGGYDGDSVLADGARYKPGVGWTVVTAGFLSARGWASAAWTGSEMIVWGGRVVSSNAYLNDGARFNPASKSWTTVSESLLSARSNASAVWTGSELIVWGGWNGANYVSDGARYHPSTNTWTSMADFNLPARDVLDTIWTGKEMIVWGGWDGSGLRADGARYDPVTDTWTPVSAAGAPVPRHRHSIIWTGSEMIVWGGGGYDLNTFADGARYNPVTDTWTPLPTQGAPSARLLHSAVWTGSEMIVWGGRIFNGGPVAMGGGRYHLASNTWAPLPTADAPAERYFHNAVWTGREMVVWGGYRPPSYLNDGGLYAPYAFLHLPLVLR